MPSTFKKIAALMVASLLLLVLPLTSFVSPVAANTELNWNSLSVGQVVARGTPVQGGGCFFNEVNGTTMTNEGYSKSIDLKVDSQCNLIVSSKSSAQIASSSNDPTNNEVDLRDPLNIILNKVIGTATISICGTNICISSYVQVCYHLNDGWVTDDCVIDGVNFVGNPSTADGHGDFHWTLCCNTFQHQMYHAEDIYDQNGNFVLVCTWGWYGTISGANHFTNECFFS
ncbi:MAG: hypothetical protein ACLQEQ_08995 [Nitrososphaerales archaeon]